MNITLSKLEEELKLIGKELLQGEFQKNPSISSLNSAGQSLLTYINQVNRNNENLNLYSLQNDLDIFLVDLEGMLLHDYNKKNVRYKEKWLKENNKLGKFISRFKKVLEENQV